MKAFYKYDRNLAESVFREKAKIRKLLTGLIVSKSEHNLNMYNECIGLEKSCRLVALVAYDRWTDRT
jgi:hypothetical protein